MKTAQRWMRHNIGEDRKRRTPRGALGWCCTMSFALKVINQLIEFKLRPPAEGLDVDEHGMMLGGGPSLSTGEVQRLRTILSFSDGRIPGNLSSSGGHFFLTRNVPLPAALHESFSEALRKLTAATLTRRDVRFARS